MSKIINILTVIDTDAVIKNYGSPSKDSNHPTPIGHSYGYMIATGTTVNSGQGTGDLSITALVGDTVRNWAVSGSNNFEDSVLLYGMPRYSGDQVFSTFQYESFTKSTVVPHSSTQPLPAATANQTFWFFQADVVKAGTENYQVQFGLYNRSQTTGQPVLFGYYQWDPQITVAG